MSPRKNPLGPIDRVGDQELERIYELLADAHETHLKALGVRLPQFRRNGLYVGKALALIALYIRLGQPVTKAELEEFIAKYKDGANDGQFGRHLGNGDGWHVLSSTRPDIGTEDWPEASYGLMSITDCLPSFRRHRSGDLTDEDWVAIQADFDNRCSLCGSKSGEPNLRNPNVITEIERGHCDPTKPLSAENCIPQCQECNRPLLQKFVFDRKGRPKAIARADVILKSPKDIQREALRLLRERLED